MEQLLIVEDDIGLNQGLCKALKADDRQIISCHDLKAAREQLLCGSVSLILLDINLPDGSGLELLQEVKENLPGVPVILLTANDTDLDIVDGLERGADDYITKPFSLSVLRARVNTQLRKQASNHKNAPFHRGYLRKHKGQSFRHGICCAKTRLPVDDGGCSAAGLCMVRKRRAVGQPYEPSGAPGQYGDGKDQN